MTEATMRMVRGKRTVDEEFDKVDLTGWKLNAIDGVSELFEKAILDAASEVLEVATRYACTAYLSSKDPMTMMVTLPMAQAETDGPTWGFSLRDIVEDEIGHRAGGDETDLESLASLSQGLRALAQKIDDELAKGTGGKA